MADPVFFALTEKHISPGMLQGNTSRVTAGADPDGTVKGSSIYLKGCLHEVSRGS